MSKTWKRETAWSMLLFCAYTAFIGNVEILEIIIWPIFLFVAAAFGMDWSSKQTDLLGKVHESGK